FTRVRQAARVAVRALLTMGGRFVDAAEGNSPGTLTVGVVQLKLEPTLVPNRDKIGAFIHQAKDRGCRVVVFPEAALYWPPNTPNAEIDAAVDALRKA